MARLRGKVTRDEIAEAVREIRAYWATGRESLEGMPDPPYGEKALVGAAKQLHWTTTKFRKARQFADPVSGYDLARLDELCGQLGEHRPHFGVSHVGVLVTVPLIARHASRARPAVQRRCIVEDWGQARLEAEVKLLHGRRPKSGRPMRAPGDPGLACVRLDDLAAGWLRWCDAAGPGGSDVIKRLAEPVQKHLTAISARMGRLRSALAEVLVQPEGRSPEAGR